MLPAGLPDTPFEALEPHIERQNDPFNPNLLQQSQQHDAKWSFVQHLALLLAAVNARHQAEKRKLQQAMAPDNVPPARTSTPGMHPNSCS